MTDIIELARKAAGDTGPALSPDPAFTGFLERFARLVIEAQDQEIAALRVDAERYWWLCASDWYVGPENFYCDESGGMHDYDNKNLSPDHLNTAIDEARSAK